jgi:hypothetical protein
MSNIIKLEIVEKYNPYHDSKGRFTSAGNATSFTIGSKSGLEWDKKNVQRAIEREKQRTSAKPSFVPAKTIEEATDYAHNVLGIENVRFGKVKVEIANQMNESIATHFEKYPELKKQFKFVGSAQERNRLEMGNAKKIKYDEWYDAYKRTGKTDEEAAKMADNKIIYLTASGHFNPGRVHGDVWAQASFSEYAQKHGTSGIAVHEKYGSKPKVFQSELDANMNSGFHPPGCNTLKSVMDHEMGHQLDKMIKASSDIEIVNLYEGLAKSKTVESSVSRYADHRNNRNKNRYGEFIAESWSEYQNNPNCRPTAKQVGKRMEEIYSRRELWNETI